MNKILKIKIISIFILVFILNPFSFTISVRGTYSNEPNQIVFKNPLTKLKGQSSTGPITIDSNSQLATLATSGSGTPTNPYIIKDYTINNCADNTPGVTIQNTNDYFILQNFSVAFCYDGFYLNTVTNGEILNSKTQNDRSDGFDAYFSSNIDFVNDLSSYTNNTGFYLYKCLKCIISKSIANKNTFYGLDLTLSNNSIVSDNIAMNNTSPGYEFESSNLTITNNIAEYNNNSAFDLSSLSNCILQNNLILNNKGGGFDLFSVSHTTIINNTIINNSYGINVGESSKNFLINNIVTFNGNGGIFVYQQSINNTLFNNFVKNNTYLYYGLYDTNQYINLASDFSTDSNNNLLSNNTFSTTALDPVISKNSTAINLKWNAPSLDNSPPILYYEVYRSITYFSPFEYTYPLKLVANTTSFSFVDTYFTNDTQNNYFILSVNSIGVITEIQISIGIGRNITTTPTSIYFSTKTIPSSDFIILFSSLFVLVFIQKQKRK